MKISPLRSIVSTSLAVLAAALAAHPARAENLADVVAYADETNPGLQAQRAALRALDESYVQARGGYGLNASINIGETSDSETLTGNPGPLGSPPFTTHSYANTDSEALTITQPLYTGGRVHSQLNEAEAQILAGRESLRRYEIDLLQHVVTAYVSVLRDEALLKINQDTVTVLEKEVSDTQSRFDVRDVTMTDVAEAKARLAQAQTQLADAQASLAISRAQFVETVGQYPTELAPPPTLDALPATVDQAFDSAENNNPQLLAAQYTEQKSRAHIAEARAAGHPNISAQVNIQHSPYLPYMREPFNNETSATVTLTQPIFTGGEISSQIREATEQNSSDRLSIDDARQQVILSVSSAWEQLSAARNQLNSLNEEVAADDFSFYGNREEAKLALRSTIDVLNAELELTNAQQSLVRARATEYIARTQVLSAMGILTASMLSPAVRPYDPAENFQRVRHKGETPLEWPARALDAIGEPKVTPPPPSSIADAKLTGSPMPPVPATETPIRSILSTLDKPPPEPK